MFNKKTSVTEFIQWRYKNKNVARGGEHREGWIGSRKPESRPKPCLLRASYCHFSRLRRLIFIISRVWEYRIEYRPDTYLDTFFVSFHCIWEQCICIGKVLIEMHRRYDTFFTLHCMHFRLPWRGKDLIIWVFTNHGNLIVFQESIEICFHLFVFNFSVIKIKMDLIFLKNNVHIQKYLVSCV